jgi:hypothetical protein
MKASLAVVMVMVMVMVMVLAAPAHAASVVVTSEPEGAEVRVDDAVVGKTPCHVRLPRGSHTIALRAEEHEADVQTLVVAGSLLRHHAVLKQKTYPIDVLFEDLTQEGWAIFDGKQLEFEGGRLVHAPATIRRPAGKYDFRLLKAGYKDIVLPVKVVGRATVLVQTKPRKGRSSYDTCLRSLVMGKWTHHGQDGDREAHTVTYFANGTVSHRCPDGYVGRGIYKVEERDGGINVIITLLRYRGRDPVIAETLSADGNRMTGRLAMTRLVD